MSQKSSQKNVVSEKSTEQYEVFDNFLIRYSEEIDCHKKTKILHSFTQVYLLNPNEYTTNAFVDVLNTVPKLCTTFLIAPISSLQEEHGNNLEKKTKNLESASLCFEVTQNCLETIREAVDNVYMVKVAVDILRLAYTHCQDSETIYGNLLEQFIDQLGIFFKKIESLQTVIMVKMNLLNAVEHFQDKSSIEELMVAMEELCEVVSGVNADTAFDCWTMYIKFLSKHQYVSKEMDLNPALTCLISKNLEILELYKYNLNNEIGEDEENFAMFCFYLNALVDILSVSNSFKNTHLLKTFLTGLLEFLTLCFSPFENCNLINTQDCLIKISYTVLLRLYRCNDLEQLITLNEQGQNLDDSETKHSKTALFLLNLCCLQFIAHDMQQYKERMFLNILLLFTTNKTEDYVNLLYARVPRCAVTDTDSKELVDVYQLAYEELSKFLTTLPDKSIQKLNNTVVFKSAACFDIDFLLISDVWLYRLRCSSDSFLRDLCHSILQQYVINAPYLDTKLETFLKRMFKFLPHFKKQQLLEEFFTLRFLHDTNNIKHRYGTPDLFSSEYEFPNNFEDKIKEMMSKLSNFDVSDVLQLVEKSCLSMELCTLFMNVSDISDILQFIELADKMFKSEVYEVQVTVLTFIKLLSRKHLPEHSYEFGKIVTIIAGLFSLAIHSKNYLIHHEALSTFSYFAKCTPHVKIVQETVRQDPSLKPFIKSYISAVPDTGFLTEDKKNLYLQKYITQRNEGKFEISESSRQALLQIFSKQLISFQV